jgi:hypothetical protein
MMRDIGWSSAAVMLASVACALAGPSQPKGVALGESFELKVGESAEIEAEALKVGFDGVSADSRCPRGEQCVWEGDATVRVWLQKGSETRETHELHTSPKGESAVIYQDYELSLLRLDPYPVSGRTIERGDYRATLQVIRGSSAVSDR